MATSKKQIAFDLDTHALQIYYSSNNWQNAYYVIRRHMIKHGFLHIQGSVYVSNLPITSTKTAAILQDLVNKNPWLSKCMRDCRETSVLKNHNRTNIFITSPNVPTRADLQAQKPQSGSTMTDWKKRIEEKRSSSPTVTPVHTEQEKTIKDKEK